MHHSKRKGRIITNETGEEYHWTLVHSAAILRYPVVDSFRSDKPLSYRVTMECKKYCYHCRNKEKSERKLQARTQVRRKVFEEHGNKTFNCLCVLFV